MNDEILNFCKQYLNMVTYSRVSATLGFVYKVITDLESIDHLCINPIRWIGLIRR